MMSGPGRASGITIRSVSAYQEFSFPIAPVKLAMVKNVVAVPHNAEVSECALKMRRARVDQLPVINGDKQLVAMLYDRDLIKALCQEGS